MSTKVFVKSKAPALVRAYNFFLLFCGRLHFIKYEVDCFKYLNIFSKEKKQTDNETSGKALNQFLENIRSKSLNPATQIFISGELDRVFANRVKVANIQNEYSENKSENNPDIVDENIENSDKNLVESSSDETKIQKSLKAQAEIN